MTDRLQKILEPIETAMFNCESYMASPMMSVAEGKKLLHLLKAALPCVEYLRYLGKSGEVDTLQLEEFDALVQEQTNRGNEHDG